MGLKEFQDLLDRYGGDPSAWPADRRPEALTFAQTSPEAFRLLRETSEMERALSGADVPEPDFAAIDRVMDRIADHEAAAAAAPARRRPLASLVLDEVRSVLGTFIYRPLLLITMASLLGIIVGVADRTVGLKESYSGLMDFILTL